LKGAEVGGGMNHPEKPPPTQQRGKGCGKGGPKSQSLREGAKSDRNIERDSGKKKEIQKMRGKLKYRGGGDRLMEQSHKRFRNLVKGKGLEKRRHE